MKTSKTTTSKKYFVTEEKLNELRQLQAGLAFEIDRLQGSVKTGTADEFIAEMMQDE